jgi:hypothetical protein
VTESRFDIIPEKIRESSADSAKLSVGMFALIASSTTLDIAFEQVSDLSSALINKIFLRLQKS